MAVHSTQEFKHDNMYGNRTGSIAHGVWVDEVQWSLAHGVFRVEGGVGMMRIADMRNELYPPGSRILTRMGFLIGEISG